MGGYYSLMYYWLYSSAGLVGLGCIFFVLCSSFVLGLETPHPHFLKRVFLFLKLGEVVGLLSLLDGIRPDPTIHDDWEWIISSKGKFTPKSLYLEITIDRSISFPVKAFGSWVSLQKSCFLFGMRTWIKFSHYTIYRIEDGIWQTNASFVWRRRNQWITYSCIVIWRLWFGVSFFHTLKSLGFVLIISVSWSWDGEFKTQNALPSIICLALPGVICWGLWKERNLRIF